MNIHTGHNAIMDQHLVLLLARMPRPPSGLQQYHQLVLLKVQAYILKKRTLPRVRGYPLT